MSEYNAQRPSFDELPLQPGHPRRSAWGLWGPHDQVGTLNMLKEEKVKAAISEVHHGIVSPLNLPLNKPGGPMNPARIPFGHKILFRGNCLDDEVNFNTQSSSQIDGLRHYPYQDTLQFYMGKTEQDFKGEGGVDILDISKQARKGIVGRGILLDYATWAEGKGISYDAFSNHRVTVSDLEEVAASQGVTFKPADILLVRYGWTKQYDALPAEKQAALGSRQIRSFVGLEGSDETLRWLWNREFSVVGGDTNAFESWPPKEKVGHSLHEVLLAGWGCPILELLDLEDLAEKCAKLGKYSFMFSSQPLNVPGGVASPPNAMAIL